MKKLPRTFYERNTLTVAKELLGKCIIHNSATGRTIGKIVEVEAYIGPSDAASHAYNNLNTPRTQIQFGRGGYAYIYQIYGSYFCFNVVTGKVGKPEVVLIRALEPIQGLDIMSKRRKPDYSPVNDFHLTNGPSKLCIAMGIDKQLYGKDLCGDTIYLADNHEPIPRSHILATARINIDYAGRAKSLPWRYVIKGNRYVSLL